MVEKKKKVMNSTSDLEKTIGHIILNAEIRQSVEKWLNDCDGNIEQCLILWITKDTHKLKVFGSNIKCHEAIGYLEIAKADLLDFMYTED
jgi:hypothetical protein